MWTPHIFLLQEQDDLLAILSGVLAVGNVSFADKGDDGAVGVTYPEDLEVAAELFSIDTKDLQDCLTCVTSRARGEQIQRNFTKHQAEGMCLLSDILAANYRLSQLIFITLRFVVYNQIIHL